MRLIVLLTTPFLLVCCGSESSNLPANTAENNTIPDTVQQLIATPDSSVSAKQYTAEVFETPDLGWGYKIYDNGTLFINQPHIPAIQGNKGFSSREKAQITADFAILKMEQGFVPPTISPKELDSLGVLD